MMGSEVLTYPPAAFHFAVAFGTQSQNIDASFREVSGIGPEMETEPLNEGGENRYVLQLPKAVKHPRLVLKRGIAPRNSPLVQWCQQTLEQGLALVDQAGAQIQSQVPVGAGGSQIASAALVIRRK